MTIHPSPSELAEFARGTLDEIRANVIEGHLFGCNQCADIVSAVPGDEFQSKLRESRCDLKSLESFDYSAATAETVGVSVDQLDHDEILSQFENHPRIAIERLVAEGGMGRVYLAKLRDNASWVAVKILKPNPSSDSRNISRFLQEARIAGQLEHPNIARVIECSSIASTHYIVMEFVAGKTLAQIVNQYGPLPAEEARQLIRQAAAGLAYAASHGVVHRDMKPQNLILQAHGSILKILDFGLGRLVDEQRTGSRLTREGDIVGTLDYISPEQAANSRGADERSDIYSLGCTFYFLLAGAPPFRGKNAIDLLAKHQTETPHSIQTLRSDVPPAIADTIDRMMQKDPALRFQSFDEVLTALGTRHVSASAAVNSYNSPAEDLRCTSISIYLRPAILLPLLTTLLCLLWLIVAE